jgi:TfoX/Sxy family transcriptional regulator of competence genes
MASKQSTVDFIVEQMQAAGAVSAKKMFGEHAVFCDGKLVGLICDDQLFVKPTRGGRDHIVDVTEAPPYPSAKPCFAIAGDQWDDAAWLAELIRVTAAELPVPVKRRRRA